MADALAGRRVLITGAARGIGALTAKMLHARGAKVALMGLEPDLLAEVARECGDAPWFECNVADRAQVEDAVEKAVGALGGLDVAVSNAGVAVQLPLIDGDPAMWQKQIDVNLNGTYYFVRSAGPHVSHPDGYVLLTASLAAAVHPPMLAGYTASKAGVEAIGNSLRAELAVSGGKVGVAYFAELDTDMTSRGFGTQAAKRLPLGGNGVLPVAPVEPAIKAIVRGIEKRRRRVVSPFWVRYVLRFPSLVMRVVDREARGPLPKSLEIAREENAPLTTPQ
jgi:NAD(P)-dependent dehydrogenase (short-subunit alcohol dehydrogenase family)